jgi:hypothetical protein
MNSAPRRVVITDVRFDNEAQWVLDQGPQNRIVAVLRDVPRMDHSSERGVAAGLVTDTVHNDGSLEALRSAGRMIHAER